MKTRLTLLISFLLAGVLVFGFSAESKAQSKIPSILMKFVRQKDGKVVKRDVVENKIFDFTIQGLSTQTDVDNFKSKFAGKPLVISVTITDIIPGGERKGSIVLQREAKADNIRELLKGAGIDTISIDGELKSVDELGKDAKASPKAK